MVKSLIPAFGSTNTKQRYLAVYIDATIRRRVLGLAAIILVLPAVANPLAPLKLDSPRDTMRSFMDAMNDFKTGVQTGDESKQKRIDDAVRCLNLGDMSFVLRIDKGRSAAIFLKEVVDRIIVVDYSKIPDLSGDDPPLRWRLKNTEIVIARIDAGDFAGEYRFSLDTVERAQEFYEKVAHMPYLPKSGGGASYKKPWLEDAIPEWALGKTFSVNNWQWIGLFCAILLGLIVKKIIEIVIHWLKKYTSRTAAEWDDKIIQTIDRPIGLVGASACWFSAVYLLRFDGTLLVVLTSVVQIVFSISMIWLFYRLIDTLTEYMLNVTAKTDTSLDDQLVPLFGKALRIFVVIFGVLVMFQNLGINVLSVLAGLGLGGLAFALAARDTCANLFGSIMILLDRPFNIGDWIIAGSAEGSVEEIGFRSTQIRTFYNSVISVPNSVLANANIDNMGRREFRRIKTFFGLKYDTPAEKMEAFLEGVRNIVEANPYTRKDYYHVVFNRYADSSLEVMLYCFLKVPDWSTELVQRQNIYLEILRLAEALGVGFAFPTQTLHMETFPGKDCLMDKHEIDSKALTDTATGFGPGGANAKPGGLGIFQPPHEANRVARGNSDDDSG